MYDSQGQNKKSLLHRLKTAALSGAATGGVLAGAGSILGGAKTLGQVVRPALKGAATLGLTAPAAIAGGEAILGRPKRDEVNPNMHRGMLGGALAGSLAGGLGAAYLASGRRLPFAKLGSLGEKIEESGKNILNADNIISNKIREYAKNPNAKNMLKAGLLGGGTLGAIGGEFSGDEGAGVDLVQNEEDNYRKKELKQRLGLE